jgi:hypothetical protein
MGFTLSNPRLPLRFIAHFSAKSAFAAQLSASALRLVGT